MPCDRSCTQAMYCPIRNTTPSADPEIQSRVKLSRRPALSARRAISRAALDPSSAAVFHHSSCGISVRTQSFDSPCRTMNALVSAAKNMTTAASSTIRPVIDARRDTPRPPDPWPPPKFPPPGGGGGSCPFQTSVVTELAIRLVFHCPGHQRWIGLHDVVPGRARNAVLVGTVVHNRMHAREIIEGRRRWNGPFER